ncbi:sulfate permease, SulP family [Nematocida sp. AWRm80]|nr:sulfate permease, SulP family [Nematocida sp. AWRm80]
MNGIESNGINNRINNEINMEDRMPPDTPDNSDSTIEMGIVSRSKNSWKDRVGNTLSGCLLYLMDSLTVGMIGLSMNDVSLFRMSSNMFVIGAMSSQLVFFLFSSLRIPVITSPISESFVAFQTLSTDLLDIGLKDSKYLSTLLFAISISTLITGLIFLVMYLLRAQRIINILPNEISTVLFFIVGCFCYKFGNTSILATTDTMIDMGIITENTKKLLILAYNIFSIGLYALSKYISSKYPKIQPYTSILLVLLLSGIIYGCMPLLSLSIDYYIKLGILQSDQTTTNNIRISIQDIQFKEVFSRIYSLIGIALLNILHFFINIPAVKKGCNTTVNVRKELLCNGISNCVSCVAGGYPTYLLSSSTIALNMNGTGKKIDTALITVVFSILFFVGRQVFIYIPQGCFDMLLLFIGMDILLECVKDIYTCSQMDRLIYIILVVPSAVVSMYYSNIQFGMVLSLCLYGCIYLLRKYVLKSN